ncbi:hypothetical protein GQ600_1549 [Phytophthora cactorum]|nr:hypothetical protein GQ600_1549 [Phytophthora cactorum]
MDDYDTLMMNDEFFEHVKGKFTDSNEPVTWEERKQLLEDKLFVVGGSARPHQRVCYGHACISSDGAVDRLFSWYRVGGNAESSLLSKHVARGLAQMLGPSFVQNISSSLSMNPSMDGHLFELWFFAKLTHGGVECYGIGQNEERILQDIWESTKVPYFSPNDMIPLNEAKHWLAPRKRNQGDYDAVFVETLDDLVGAQAMKVRVRFVQVTRADKHSFKDQHFATFFNQTDHGLVEYRFEVVGVYFVVPIRKLSSFEKKVSVKQVQKDVLEPAGLSAETTRVAIEVVGLNYKEFRASDDPERLEVKRFKIG